MVNFEHKSWPYYCRRRRNMFHSGCALSKTVLRPRFDLIRPSPRIIWHCLALPNFLISAITLHLVKQQRGTRLSPSQKPTRKLIRNQTNNIKVTKHNLFSARGFPDYEWTKVIQVDFNVILSCIHTTATDNWVIKTVEFHFGHAKPTKLVKHHGDWLIAFSDFQWVVQFVYPHWEACYGEYISVYFAFVDPGVHSRIINLNKLIHKWSGAVNSILLNKFKKFQFLEIWHLYRKTAADVQGSATWPVRNPKWPVDAQPFMEKQGSVPAPQSGEVCMSSIWMQV